VCFTLSGEQACSRHVTRRESEREKEGWRAATMTMAAFRGRRVSLALFFFLLRDEQATKRARPKRERREEAPPYLLRAMTGKGRKKKIIVMM
jgi:hypothetical protein